jgi:hypothetical protein
MSEAVMIEREMPFAGRSGFAMLLGGSSPPRTSKIQITITRVSDKKIQAMPGSPYGEERIHIPNVNKDVVVVMIDGFSASQRQGGNCSHKARSASAAA